MDKREDQRIWGNFRRGLVCLALGAVAVVAIEVAWDAIVPGRAETSANGTDAKATSVDGGIGYEDMAAFVFGDDARVGGGNEIPAAFIAECFDPYGMGEVSSSDDGDVIGIVSSRGAKDLFDACNKKLEDRGWIRVGGGRLTRCTFLKNGGSIRWIFLDVTQVADSGVAVIVLEEGA